MIKQSHGSCNKQKEEFTYVFEYIGRGKETVNNWGDIFLYLDKFYEDLKEKKIIDYFFFGERY